MASHRDLVDRLSSLAIQKFGFINGVDNVNWPPYRDSKADVSSVSPSSERIKTIGDNQERHNQVLLMVKSC